MKAYLCLADGTIFEGESIGLAGETAGEVVFNTSMTGYQEILTDPSYAGQLITLTYPLIGNYGVNKEDAQSKGIAAKGLIIKEFCNEPSNYRSEKNLQRYLVEEKVVGIKDVDTRALTRHIRTKGTMMGLISTETDYDKLRKKAATLEFDKSLQLVKSVTAAKTYPVSKGKYPIVMIDYGTKKNIIDSLVALDCQVTVVPAEASAEEILALNPWGVLLSNGPGDPRDLECVLPTIKKLVETKIPMMGICLGHQLLGLALGADIFKMKFGHRGGNHPVKDLTTNRIHITSQNHGYAIDPQSLEGKDAEITHINLHDHTIEGIRHKEKKIFSVQFHPEAFPGPQDVSFSFDIFLNDVKEYGRTHGSEEKRSEVNA